MYLGVKRGYLLVKEALPGLKDSQVSLEPEVVHVGPDALDVDKLDEPLQVGSGYEQLDVEQTLHYVLESLGILSIGIDTQL